MSEEFREEAEKHWKFVEGLLLKFPIDEFHLSIIKYLYITALIHGFGHGRELYEIFGET
jgi:hypothetical protein